jgi:hypothetical protein
MRIAVVNTAIGKYFYYHFLPLVKDRVSEAVLIDVSQVTEFKNKGFKIASDLKEFSDINLEDFIKVEVAYSFTHENLKKFKEVLDELNKKS